MREIIVIAHNLRSCHNVGSLLRTAEGLGVRELYFTGYTPYPQQAHDTRLPHESQKITRQIHKTALGAEHSVRWQHRKDVFTVFEELTRAGYLIAAVEQSPHSMPLPTFTAPQKIALLVGREVEGVEPEVLEHVNQVLEIPMFGQKESFNVVQAAAMALYHCRFYAEQA